MSSSASRSSKRQASSVSESIDRSGEESSASAKVKSSKGRTPSRRNTRIPSEESDTVTIQVPKGFADQASFGAMNKLRSELSALRDKQEKDEEIIDAMQNEIRSLKESLAENTAAIEKYKEKSKKKLAKYEAKISQALEVYSIILSVKSYTDLYIRTSNSFENKKGNPDRKKKFLYFPKLIFMIHEQHGFAIGTKAQESQEHNFEVSSSFSGLPDDERELFFDLAKRRGESSSGDIFYAGTYKCVRLDHLYPEGISYSDDIYNEFGLPINRVTAMVVDAQIQRPRLRRDEIADLVKSGVIKLEFIGLQCIGFNSDLNRRITGSTPASAQIGTKRPRGLGSAPLPNDKRSRLS
ncbi:hypothetical protein VNI00_008661 [Paramarasmius palmivorus]|uniref:Uncharacterized protein n=1 Tax=Paramarasmius palmivorus TaxID=297713 RepID=A0AAW0CVA4_9AGAR